MEGFERLEEVSIYLGIDLPKPGLELGNYWTLTIHTYLGHSHP